MRNVLLPREGIWLVKQAPPGLWTPVWFQFVGPDEDEGRKKEAAGDLETHS